MESPSSPSTVLAALPPPPDFFVELLGQKQIRNPPAEVVARSFPDPVLSLEKEVLYVVGVRKGLHYCEAVRLLEHEQTEELFIGWHTLEYRRQYYGCSSLSNFRRDVMGFEDSTEFQRSAFLLHETNRCAVRLKQIREKCRLPGAPLDPRKKREAECASEGVRKVSRAEFLPPPLLRTQQADYLWSTWFHDYEPSPTVLEEENSIMDLAHPEPVQEVEGRTALRTALLELQQLERKREALLTFIHCEYQKKR